MLAELEVNGLVVPHDPAEVLEVREHLGVNEEWFVLGQEGGEHTWNWWHVYVLDFEVDLGIGNTNITQKNGYIKQWVLFHTLQSTEN